MSSRVGAEIFALLYHRPAELLLQPRLTIEARPSLKLSFGLAIFAGPDDQAFGALGEYSSFFGEARWYF